MGTWSPGWNDGNVRFALVRFSVDDAISYPITDFQQYGGKKILIVTRYDLDVPKMTSPGTVVLLPMRNLSGVAATAGRTSTLGTGISYRRYGNVRVFSKIFTDVPL